MQQKTIVGVAIVIALAFGAMFFFSPREKVIEKVTNTVRDPVSGAVSVLASPIEIDGTQTYYERKTINVATTTVCSFKTPAATTTGQIWVRLTSSPAYVTYQMARGATPNATTTDLGSFTDGDGISTADTIFPPSVYLNVKLGTTSGTTVGSEFNPTGTCGKELRLM